jgi:hypothetical protein
MLAASDVDKAWDTFDNVKQVTIAVFDPASEQYIFYNPPIVCDALLFEREDGFTEGPDESLIHRETRVIVLRAMQLIPLLTAKGKVFSEDYRIIDNNGISWIVDSFKLMSWETRFRCECYRV